MSDRSVSHVTPSPPLATKLFRTRALVSLSVCTAFALAPLAAAAQRAPAREPPVRPASSAPWSGPSAAPLTTVIPGQNPARPPPAREPPLELPPEPPPRDITLAEVLTIAQRDAPSVLTALANAHISEMQVANARTPLIPSVSASAGASFSLQNGQQFTSGTLTGNNISGAAALSASVSAQWMIWDFGRVNANVRAAERGLEGTRADAREAVRAAVGQASVAFFQLLSDHQLTESAREIVRQRERQLEIAQGLVEAGARPPIERTRAEVSLDTARLDLLSAQTSLRTDAATLAVALALDPSIPLRPISPGGTVLVDDDPTHAGDAAERGRYDLASARARVAQTQEQLEAARAAYRPTISANASLSARITAPLSGIGVLPSESVNVGAQISVPIFDASIPAQVHTAEAQVAAAQATLRARTVTVRSEAVQAAIAVRSSRVALAQAQRLAVGSAANLAQAEGRYAAGAAPLLELVDAQAADATARVSIVRAQVSFELAKVRLLASLGRLGDLEQRAPADRGP